MESLTSNYGICTVCAGQSNGECFCSSLSPDEYSSLSEYISNQLLFGLLQDHPTQPTQPIQPNHQASRPKKDNTAHKRFNTILKEIYILLLGKNIDKCYKQHYHRKDYFIMILSQLERQGKNAEAQIMFQSQMDRFAIKIQEQPESEPEYRCFMLKLIKVHLKAFSEFNSGEIEEAMKTIYLYEEMRQRKKFRDALELIQNIRNELGLPYE